MIRKLIGAAIGARVAKRHPAAGGATGVVIASAVPFVLKRLSLPGMIALGVGGYVAKRVIDKAGRGQTGAAALPLAPPPPTTPVPVVMPGDY